MEEKNNHFLSLIVPAYGSEKIIDKVLLKYKQALDDIRYQYEIICVVDGNVDDTYKVAQKIANKFPSLIKVYSYEKNLGKGYAVRYGMARSKGDLIAFADAGLEINPRGIYMMVEHFDWYDADIVICSKRHPASKVVYPWQRRVMSFVYQYMVHIMFGLNVKDTQVGMKLFKRQVLEKTLPRLLVKEFAFDIEMLAVANYLGFKRIYEAPVDLRRYEFSGGVSTIISKGFTNTVFKMVRDTLAVFYRLNIIHYYDYSNRRNWPISENLVLRKNS
jgi:glycosyltransferase involved in cell wall biosynthesis